MSTPSFDLTRLSQAYPDVNSYRGACLQLAKASERSERYDDAARFIREIMKCTVQNASELTEEEKNILYLSYKNIFHKLRTSYKLVSRAHYNAEHAPTVALPTTAGSGVLLPAEDRFPELLREYKTYTEAQIQTLCTEITQLMENTVVKTTQKVESKVFYSKLCGDYYRYCRYERTQTLAVDCTCVCGLVDALF